MKKRFILEPVEEDFRVYAINSHAKGYSLCWKINQQFKIDLERVSEAVVQNSIFVGILFDIKSPFLSLGKSLIYNETRSQPTKKKKENHQRDKTNEEYGDAEEALSILQ